MNRFTVNGVTYTAKPFDFETLCDLEVAGVNIQSIDTMSFSLIRGYFAVCAGIDKSEAASLIQTHIVNGGNMEDISEAMNKEMEDSDFFRALAKRKQAGESENSPKDTTESAEETSKKGRKSAE